MFRILLIPLFVWLYIVKKEYEWTAGILVLSGLTDTLDGYIARKNDMVTAFGTAIDPIADKLTQICMVFCLMSRFPAMRILVVGLVIKELAAGIMSLIILKRKNLTASAEWHGKLCTWLLYITMVVHVLWADIPQNYSYISTFVILAVLLLSSILYTKRNIALLK